ncbi:cytochrome-c peroxidase [Coralliovum pocilloporae]|uniref:cytochrome-c peroxidase n=1 Tax=Coralliovum pocilloporae TaxID=3066369 RepID=UPI003307ACA2
MTPRKTGRISLLAAVSAAALMGMAVVSTAQADDPGPISPLEVDAKKAELGKRLFFDPRLSGDGELSCSSCHQPEKGFTDGQALSDAYAGSLGFRNVPTLINTAMREAWFHDGRLGTNLNDVTRESITETYNMNMDMRLMQERLKQDPVYVKMFKEAGYGEPSNGSVRKAIPEYLKTLTSRGAPFDKGEMSEAAQAGYELFKGKAGCVQCHSGNRFTDDQPHNIGTPENPEIFKDPLRHITYVTFTKFLGVENYMNLRRDVGAYVRAHPSDRSTVGSFMTPTLRELKQTGPYMHNGMFNTLFEVVAFYNQGGGEDPNKDPLIQPLGLTFEEEKNLVAFLEALSGDVLTGPEFVPDEIDTDYQPIANWRKTPN